MYEIIQWYEIPLMSQDNQQNHKLAQIKRSLFEKFGNP